MKCSLAIDYEERSEAAVGFLGFKNIWRTAYWCKISSFLPVAESTMLLSRSCGKKLRSRVVRVCFAFAATAAVAANQC